MTLIDDLNKQLWVVAAVGRLAGRGLLEREADPDDEVSVLAQQLLVEAGWLDTDPVRPGAAVLAGLPQGAPLSALGGHVRERLAQAVRFADGAGPGWAESNRELVRFRGRTSGGIVRAIMGRCCGEALADAGSLLDVGVGAAGIPIRLCGEFPGLRAVGIDVSPVAVEVAREEVAASGFGDRIEIREQSVGELAEVEAFDLVWVPQQFIPREVLVEALPRVLRAMKGGGTLVMALGRAGELENLMFGGGTLGDEEAVGLLEGNGFVDVRVWGGDVVTGRR